MQKKTFLKLSLTLFFILELTSCSKNYLEEEWYLIGGDIRLDLDISKKKVTLYDKNDLVFDSTLISEDKHNKGEQLLLKMDKIGSAYKEKYKNIEQFSLGLYRQENKIMKVLFTKFSSKPYFFTSIPKNSELNYRQGRFLFKTETDSFMQDFGGYKDLFRNHSVSITSNTNPTMSEEDVKRNEKSLDRNWMRQKYEVPGDFVFNNMFDYTYDMDFSSAYITKDTKKLNLEYSINEIGRNLPVPLKNPIKIKAILINAGNLNDKSQYKHYNRPKTISFSFSTDYFNGLGATMANYNNVQYTITLKDSPQTNIIVFYKPVEAKVIMANVDSYYVGDENEMALFDLVFFTSN